MNKVPLNNEKCSSRGSWMGTNSSSCANSYTSSYQRFKKQYSDSPILRQILASSLGTCVSVLTLNPISVVKLRLQRQDIFTETTAKGAFRTIFKKDGISGFWAGTIQRGKRADSWLLHDSPLVTKTKHSAEIHSHSSPLITLRIDSYRLWCITGSRIGLMQSLPSSVIYMTIYEKLKTELAQNSAGNVPSLIPGIAGNINRFDLTSMKMN